MTWLAMKSYKHLGNIQCFDFVKEGKDLIQVDDVVYADLL